MAHQPLPAVSDVLVGALGKEAGHLGFNGLGEQRSRAIAQNLRQPAGKCPWLDELENVSVGHGVSLPVEKWRLEHPHDDFHFAEVMQIENAAVRKQS